jgi:ATP-dependent DNA ligase
MQARQPQQEPIQVVRVFEGIARKDSCAERHSGREVVCLDNNGVSQFNDLISRKGASIFYAFDLLWLDGGDLRKFPLIERKRLLQELLQHSGSDRIVCAQHVEGQGIGFFAEICARDLEGIVAKHKKGIYKNNGLGWKKIKNPKYSQSVERGDLFKLRRVLW